VNPEDIKDGMTVKTPKGIGTVDLGCDYEHPNGKKICVGTPSKDGFNHFNADELEPA